MSNASSWPSPTCCESAPPSPQRSSPPASRSPSSSCPWRSARALVTAGIIALICTPLLRVAAAMVIYLRLGDVVYGVICLAVLLFVLAGMLLGEGHSAPDATGPPGSCPAGLISSHRSRPRRYRAIGKAASATVWARWGRRSGRPAEAAPYPPGVASAGSRGASCGGVPPWSEAAPSAVASAGSRGASCGGIPPWSEAAPSGVASAGSRGASCGGIPPWSEAAPSGVASARGGRPAGAYRPGRKRRHPASPRPAPGHILRGRAALVGPSAPDRHAGTVPVSRNPLTRR